MYLYGGSYSLENNKQFFALDMTNLKWEVIKNQGLDNKEENIPLPRDEHTAILVEDTMVVFGGFEAGQRTNDIFKYHFDSGVWEKVVC